MALYLVRWHELRVSLIEAKNEAELLDRVDEVSDPSSCTWEIYRGPLWVDLRFPADFEINRTRQGRLQRHEIEPKLGEESLTGLLELELPSSDTACEMQDEVMRASFPRLANLFEQAERDDEHMAVISPQRLEREIVSEILDHDRRVAHRSVTFDFSGRGSYVLRRTETNYFAYRNKRFRPITGEAIDAFSFGERSMKPDETGEVRVVAVEVAFAKRRPLSVRLSHARAFTTRANGLIVPPHAADAFSAEAREKGAPFLRQRNAAVRWKLNSTELERLRETLSKKFGSHLELDTLGHQNQDEMDE